MSTLIARENIFVGRVLELGVEQHAMPDGRRAGFEIVRHSGGAAVLPLMADDSVLLIRQFRPAVGAMVYEIPAGRLEAGESASECARRELIEEAGYAAAQLAVLGGFWSTVGFCDEFIHLFLARHLTLTARQPEPDEVIELCPMPLAEALAKVKSGEILDSKTQLALLLYQNQSLET